MHAKHYRIVSGTGRAGTTLLMRILSRAGVNTGFDPDALEGAVDDVAHAGLERDLRQRPDCDVVKSPWIATYIEEVLAAPDIVIDHAILCMRDLRAAAESRRRVQRKRHTAKPVNGGLWGTTDPNAQEGLLAVAFFHLVFHLTRHGVPITFLHFPRYASDERYFLETLEPVFRDVGAMRLLVAHQREARPSLITNFAAA
jgi:hypothetical protein